MMRYKAVIFDLFHTLVDVAAAPGASGRYTADILGVGREEWNRACFGPAHDICAPSDPVAVIRALAHTLDPTIDEALIREAAQERQHRFDHALRAVKSEVLEVLDRLRSEGYRLGLLSNASSGEVAAWSRSPLAPRFDAALFSCEVGSCKPQAQFYHHALERLGLSHTEVLFVGDGGSDEHPGARAVGIDNVLTTEHIGHYSEERLAPRRAAARWEIASLQELPGLLRRLQGAGGEDR